ncbi:MAG TPA: hypothetical protein VG248_18410 [Caulobacteraceae bacterium]|nr:hypothetical protein [Caulobacteraceae bacterium]
MRITIFALTAAALACAAPAAFAQYQGSPGGQYGPYQGQSYPQDYRDQAPPDDQGAPYQAGQYRQSPDMSGQYDQAPDYQQQEGAYGADQNDYQRRLREYQSQRRDYERQRRAYEDQFRDGDAPDVETYVEPAPRMAHELYRYDQTTGFYAGPWVNGERSERWYRDRGCRIASPAGAGDYRVAVCPDAEGRYRPVD